MPRERRRSATSPSTGAGRSAGRCRASRRRSSTPTPAPRCGAGEVGELWLRGPFLMEGYYGRERHETFTPDGWYRTGDLFHVDADGFFYFTGRRGDMIKTAGANVSPREVEAAIADVDRARRARRRHRRSPNAGSSSPPRSACPRGRTAPDVDELRAALRDAAVGVQGAAALPRARRRRGPDAVERQARRARAEGAVP